MNTTLYHQARALDLPPLEKAILKELCVFADESGQCSPTGAQLAKMTGYSIPSVWVGIRSLKESKHITKDVGAKYRNAKYTIKLS